MALFRKFFYRKPPDGLLEITERVYVFDSCFSTDVFDDDKYQDYIGDIVSQLQCHFADASFMVFNFREGESQSLLANILSSYDMVVMDYPRQYEGCPLVTIEMIHHFLRSGESWLSLSQQNVLIMHCERGGWAVLAFMLAGLLLYRKQYIGEQRTLEMIYRQAPRELIQLLSPLNPMPSQIRYLHYISRRNVSSVWPPGDRALTLDCVILRNIPGFNGEGGCRPIFRIYGKDPLLATSNTPKVLFSTPKRSKYVRLYKKIPCFPPQQLCSDLQHRHHHHFNLHPLLGALLLEFLHHLHHLLLLLHCLLECQGFLHLLHLHQTRVPVDLHHLHLLLHLHHLLQLHLLPDLPHHRHVNYMLQLHLLHDQLHHLHHLHQHYLPSDLQRQHHLHCLELLLHHSHRRHPPPVVHQINCLLRHRLLQASQRTMAVLRLHQHLLAVMLNCLL
uniref:Formin-like protein n=1 Tax=Oryza punctata TaxID=4537 RepID=A0A0E0LT99_ORYPU